MEEQGKGDLVKSCIGLGRLIELNHRDKKTLERGDVLQTLMKELKKIQIKKS